MSILAGQTLAKMALIPPLLEALGRNKDKNSTLSWVAAGNLTLQVSTEREPSADLAAALGASSLENEA